MLSAHFPRSRTFRDSRILQVGLIGLFWLAGEALVRLTGLPLPGGIVGMAIVLLLLASHRLNPGSMRRGAEWLLAEMLLFFVPAVLALMNHREFLGLLGLKILAVIAGGTLAVMAVTALTVELFYRWRSKHGAADTLVG
ncbi:CidA/LrgA family protein [Azospirillum picis]|uniref:Holin-like protein n=1 Tax=Azospirillum picis TaxID=488438 RepID=A0ABU0MVX7_9PROT|nr:CidA/LrgA family protein [Azospirillum picis]MBP2301874.1 holin-like protein [Azospirillum picis]MDQ0537226.1 holin-like protein [Azospirillum picis]